VIWLSCLAGMIILQRLLELMHANNNRRWMLAHGAREFGAEHYPLFFVLHAGWLVGWYVEAVWRGLHLSGFWYLWLVAFSVAQGLRYWCIASLGRFWNTRILTLQNAKLVCNGPYRFFRHPNYWAVAIELIAVPLIFDAWLTAIIVTVLNAVLLLKIRIPAEERALRDSSAALNTEHC